MAVVGARRLRNFFLADYASSASRVRLELDFFVKRFVSSLSSTSELDKSVNEHSEVFNAHSRRAGSLLPPFPDICSKASGRSI